MSLLKPSRIRVSTTLIKRPSSLTSSFSLKCYRYEWSQDFAPCISITINSNLKTLQWDLTVWKYPLIQFLLNYYMHTQKMSPIQEFGAPMRALLGIWIFYSSHEFSKASRISSTLTSTGCTKSQTQLLFSSATGEIFKMEIPGIDWTTSCTSYQSTAWFAVIQFSTCLWSMAW